MQDWVLGLAGSLLIAGFAYKKRSLSLSGMIAAVIIGTMLFSLGSISWFGTLIAFFVSSSVLSKWKHKTKEHVESGYEKTGRRDSGQVLANGALAVGIAAANFLWPNPLWWHAFIGVMATVNADTWATEIGGASKQVPRSILNWKQVPSGTSGGVTKAGMAASIAGGIFIGLSAWILTVLFPFQVGITIPADSSVSVSSLVLIGLIAGLVGSLTDSLLGASWQTMYQCEVCGRQIERRIHCNRPTRHIRGFTVMNNDTVNLVSSMGGGIIAVWIGWILGK
ncbi:DUF92 domain-containing protein [Effusibacillus lacus]|uniref:Membrane protein n=1 Tax=Effusibacillus lacus TaxID=1348429 RepID=A0A292YSB1_9BACL|nr:DUF92 domain-containing protein [Effusibacillus lacus]TCS76272.1 uncharacterized protein (TIGR00297 family) [Effusibacillus lacus]GAX91819.1 membrane protein [Effusibacillus lacus]